MKPIIEWEYFKHFRHYAKLYCNFMVHLKETQAADVNDSDKIRIRDAVLNPLSRISESIYLYGNYTNRESFVGTSLNYLQKRGKLQIFDKNLSAYLPVLDTRESVDPRGSLLFQLSYDKDILSDILSNSHDPSVMSGIGSQCTKSAIRYAKSKMNDDCFFAILSQVNSGLEWLFFIANESMFIKLTELAGKYCKVSQDFINCYGPGVELPPLQSKAVYGTHGFAE